MRLALDKGHQFGASQSVMSRLENDILGNASGQEAVNAMITRSTDALLKRKNKKRRNNTLGLATLCVGGGMGMSMLIENE